MTRDKVKKIQKRKGAALVEFAIVAPFLLIMLIGMIEFGRVMIIQQNITTAARQAAREATLPGATTNDATEIAELFANQVPNNQLDVTFDPTPEDAEPGDVINVDVGVSISAISQLGAVWFGNEATLSATAAMRKEGFE